MTATVSFRCEGCDASLRAPLHALGRTGSCPICGHRTTVRPQPPDPEGPVLVGEEEPTAPPFTPAWTA
jgi:DNA-directed RNA polymerase subunit RPC12/RpoP